MRSEITVENLEAEIRRSPVEVGSLSHDLQGFYHHPNGGWPWDFLNHQQVSPFKNLQVGCQLQDLNNMEVMS